MGMSDRIILVDDEVDLATALAEYLNLRGYDAIAVAGGFAYDVAAATHPPDLVVLDLAMPGEQGRDLLERIRSRSNVPVIIHSGTADLIDRVLLLELGAADVVPKPVAPRELLARIENVLARGSGVRRELVRFETTTVDLKAALVLRDDGAVVAVGFRKLWPSSIGSGDA